MRRAPKRALAVAERGNNQSAEGSNRKEGSRSRTRVEAARRQLERTDIGLKQVASAAGFGSVDVMRRAFVRLLGIPPRRYREFTEHSICD